MRNKILNISDSKELKYQLKILFDELDHLDCTINDLIKEIELAGAPYYKEINLLTSMQGISVLSAIAIVDSRIKIA